ncbi:hypothetical protein CCACVL1_07793 [Corchorus capsularis]|uniref:Apple domain-containing protein n=1 Tax=Corchorus capsularis TaxID=210143 RepID=A0A1R3J3W4_COCAP|nr:hypothetical protein CCACVL1_07793 [Corchorus capsularis]
MDLKSVCLKFAGENLVAEIHGKFFLPRLVVNGFGFPSSKVAFFSYIDGDDFTPINGTMPTSMLVRGSINMGFTDCELMCRSNCSCVAFASLQDDEIGCQLYFGNKNHLRNVMEKGVGIVYVRGKVPEDRVD